MAPSTPVIGVGDKKAAIEWMPRRKSTRAQVDMVKRVVEMSRGEHHRLRAMSLSVDMTEVMSWRKVVKVANARIVGAAVVLARLAT